MSPMTMETHKYEAARLFNGGTETAIAYCATEM